MHEDENVMVLVERDNLLFSIVLIIEKVDESWAKKQKLTFVATNQYGFDEAVVVLNTHTPKNLNHLQGLSYFHSISLLYLNTHFR